MSKKVTEQLKILIVEDRQDWRTIFKKTIGSNYDIIEAWNLGDAETAIMSSSDDLTLAIVDIRLLEEKTNQDGLLVIQLLKERKVPTIATSAFATPQRVRDAFYLGRVRDFWFKDEEKIVEWRGNIHEIIADVNFNKANQNVSDFYRSPRESFIQKAAEEFHQITLEMLREPQAQLQRWFVATQVFVAISLVLILTGAASILFWNAQLGTLTSISSVITGVISSLLLRQLNKSKKDFDASRIEVLEQYKNALKQLYAKTDIDK